VDANQDQIVVALRAAGASVWIISLPVDLLVGYKGHTFLVEIKTGAKKPFNSCYKPTFLKVGAGVHWQGLIALTRLYA
jgi:hypothetical protein